MRTLFALATALLGVAAAPALAIDGREVITQAQARNGFGTWSDRKSEITLRSWDEGVGVTREAEVSERTDPHGEHRTFIEFTAPTDVKGTRILHVSPRGVPDEYWIWMPSQHRVRRIGGNAGGTAHRDEIFFGTEMSYRDLELIVRIQQWNDAAAAVRLEREEACGEATCYRVEVTPSGRTEFPFARYLLWYSKDDLLLRRVELYEPDGTLTKRVSCEDYFATGRYQTPRSCTIEHVRTKTRAVITVKAVAYDTELADDLFTVANVSRGP